jgi:DNA polymerase-3 subunit delta
MKIYPDKLPAMLHGAQRGLWMVSGDEALLVSENADAVRASARRAGCAEREVHFIERGFDWSALQQSLDSRSLFAERRLIELRLPTGKPGDQGAATIAALAERADPELFILIVSSKLGAAANAAWVKSVETHGTHVTVFPLDAERLPQWLGERCARAGLDLDAAAVAALAARVEGNLLAAQQEIDKLALLHGGGKLTADALNELVTDSARFNVNQLIEAVLRGDAVRALRTLAGLRAEGEELTLLLWNISREIEALQAEKAGAAKRLWRPPAQARAFDTALRRLARIPLARLSFRLMRVDRMLKGRMPGEPWDELSQLAAEFCGLRMPLVRR